MSSLSSYNFCIFWTLFLYTFSFYFNIDPSLNIHPYFLVVGASFGVILAYSDAFGVSIVGVYIGLGILIFYELYLSLFKLTLSISLDLFSVSNFGIISCGELSY